MLYIARSKIAKIFSNLYILQRTSTANIYCNGKRIISLNPNLIEHQNVRHKSLFGLFRQRSSEHFKRKDNIPDGYQLIYRNTMQNYLLSAQLISTILAGFAGGALILREESDKFELGPAAFREQPGTVQNEMYIYMTFFVGFCVVMQYFVQRVPLRIYNYPRQNDYILIFYGALPGTTKRLTCKANEVIKLNKSSILMPWTESSYQIKDQCRVIMIENFFRTPADLSILLGNQKHPENE